MNVLLLNQCFYPDVVATAQYLTDLAVGLAERGHSVTVVASQRGYDDPTVRFPKHEVWNGINIIRIPSLGLGKAAKWRRAADFGSYLLSCVTRLAILPRFDVVVTLTSPPLISFLGALFVQLKGGRFIFWSMDLNPDEAIAAGWLREGSLVTTILERMLKYSLHRADRIIVLDRFMRQRILHRGITAERILVIPPWSHDDVVHYDDAGRRAFRERHGLSDKYVVMYSGNHSPCHPLDTLLQAAERLKARPEILFCFVGGGSEFKKVQTFASAQHLENIKCLPYQPLNQLSASLSSADVHVVVMGNAFTGIVHPSKIYNMLRIGLPVLAIGPEESHIMDVLRDSNSNGQARIARHGDIDAVIKHLVEATKTDRPPCPSHDEFKAAQFSKSTLLPRMIDMIEAMSG